MHDSLVVAFEIRRPWPKIHKPRANAEKFRIGLRAFWYVAGRELYFPAVLVIWHQEPNNQDSFTICKHNSRWRFHIHHWRIQVPPLQHLRRRLLTRCAWCGGRETRREAVNVSHSWNGQKVAWWRGERGLFHRDCSPVAHAHGLCYCETPDLSHEGYGKCRTCGGGRAWGKTPTPAQRLLATVPEGDRIPATLRPEVERLWAEQGRRR